MSALIMKGDMVKLRPLEISDSRILVDYLNNEVIKEFLSSFFPVNNFLEEEWIRRNAISHNNLTLGIEVDDKLVGTAGFMNIDWITRSAEYGIAIYDPAYWNKGIGTETTKLMLKYGFEYLNLNRIWLEVFENNPRAIRVYGKCGFIQEGRERQGRYYKGHYWDVIHMSILAEEYWRLKTEL